MSSAPGAVAAVTPAADAPASEVRYAGLATRAISFALDAAVINLVATIVGVGAALILSLLHLPHTARTVLAVIGGVAYVLWVIGYFVAFWSTAGQTLGARAMRIRVLTADGHTLGVGRGLVRCAGIALAAVPLFLGFAPVLFDDQRRAFQDWLARTVVVEAAERRRLLREMPS
jgi:uncharacterized RDD family membrane protein YckC